MQGKALDIASVFYALALLHLPKLSMAQNFVHAVEAGSELQVSMKRINDFLSLPEPPAPAHHSQGPPGLAAKVSVGCGLLAVGCWLLAVGCWLLSPVSWLLPLASCLTLNVSCLLSLLCEEG